MKIVIFGATGLPGRECLSQCLEAGHEVSVLARTPAKLPPALRERIRVVEGDGLDPAAVEQALAGGVDGAFFAVGIDKLYQIEILNESRDVEWVGIRPLQMRKPSKCGSYRVGFHRYSGLSKITAGDCACEMTRMLTDDTWLHRAPVIQY